jgi:myo-inositol-1-phosphate synthase
MTGTGVWVVGARGNVAATAMVGARAVARGATDTTGLVTAREPCTRLDLPPIEEFVFGGHDIREQSVTETAEQLSESGVPDARTLDAVRDDLAAIDERVRRGTAVNCGRALELADGDTLEEGLSLREVVDRIRDDVESFRREADLDRVVVVNLASSEPAVADPDRYDTVAAVETAIDEDDAALPASSLYAYAAIVDDNPYVNFTPSTGATLGGLRELARERDVPHAGRDGKTGETLVKSALAPMFAARNLHVLTWEGHNILGNADGEVLEDDANKAGKLATKGGVLDSILDGPTHNRVRIDYTPSLGDWKTAWDFVHFEGFLDTRMKLQFTWEGCDSALAAPLVLDLVRLVAYADEHGEGGIQPQTASFFKQPLGVDEHDLSRQFDLLVDYVDRHADGRGEDAAGDDDGGRYEDEDGDEDEVGEVEA